ncbi:transposase [Streptomyces sp. NPDC007905]|uniref:transposase n=1 Tax=Streptomyces sp. NPDC007905 TaxID=3364788 RepID=UPI0036E4FB85
MIVTPGQRADCTHFKPVLEKIRVPRIGLGRPRKKPDSLAADRAYSNRPCREYLRRRGIRHTIPEKTDSQAARASAGRGIQPGVPDDEPDEPCSVLAASAIRTSALVWIVAQSRERSRATRTTRQSTQVDAPEHTGRQLWKAWLMTWTLPEPMLAAPVSDPDLPPGWAAEPKWEGSPDTSSCFIRVTARHLSARLWPATGDCPLREVVTHACGVTCSLFFTDQRKIWKVGQGAELSHAELSALFARRLVPTGTPILLDEAMRPVKPV